MPPILFRTRFTLTRITLVLIILFTGNSIWAADLNCSGPQMGEIFIDTKTGNVTKSAEESLTVEVATENTHYRFEFKGKKSQFKATINRASGQIILEDACTPECWGGPIFGICTPVKAKF
jgi:hypothetical protein